MPILVVSEPCMMRRPVLEALSGRSCGVRLLASDADDVAKDFPSHLQPRADAAHSHAAMVEAFVGCDTMIQLTMPTCRAPDGHELRVDMRRLRRIIDTASDVDVRRLVSLSPVSSTSFSSQRDVVEQVQDDATEAEAIIRAFHREWMLVRAGVVYGPDDPVVSPLIGLMRTWLVAPALLESRHRLQPLWHCDLAEMLARGVDLDSGLTCRTIPVAGPVTLTARQLLEHIAQLLDRHPVPLPAPPFVADAVSQALTLYEDRPHDVVASANVSRVFGITPTPLDAGLRTLINDRRGQSLCEAAAQ